MLNCVVCDSADIIATTYSDYFLVTPRDFDGPKMLVEGLECYLCNTCGADPIEYDQIKRNEERIRIVREQYAKD